ncbi:MAG: hypothetical protein NZ769_06025 [Anaerolineae bacterium]|nr:hypothetical protein [Anaerolineae bacterium]MCX8068674.1 hypothetical protein [Anaerolineae bacterium]
MKRGLEQTALLNALEVFRRTLRKMGGEARNPGGRRQLLALWLPCQTYLDRMVETLPAGQGSLLRLLRQEVEDNLLDDPCGLAALHDSLDALDHFCRWVRSDEPGV